MLTYKVYKNIELTKFLEVNDLDMRVEEEIGSFDTEYNEKRAITAVMSCMKVGDCDGAEGYPRHYSFVGRGDTPDEAMIQLARFIELTTDPVYKIHKNPVTDKHEIGKRISIPPLVHTPCLWVKDEAPLIFLDFVEDLGTYPFPYELYE